MTERFEGKRAKFEIVSLLEKLEAIKMGIIQCQIKRRGLLGVE